MIIKEYLEFLKLLGNEVAYFFQIISGLGPLLTSLSILIVYFNVDRTQKRNRQNDVEKFKRDLGLKAADELIEAITLVKTSWQEILAIKEIYLIFLNGKVDLDTFKQYFSKAEKKQHDSTIQIVIQYKKREIILQDFSEEIEWIYEKGGSIAILINEFNSYFTENIGYSDQYIGALAEKIAKETSEDLLRINKLLQEIQNKFLGEIYGKKV
ncbi:hypothetical protein PQ456_13310 [Paenibacillus kyungheensis]|uniref:Uncharacterized protein n=1 Tax=Paenibacillus kyungheensis TaxID=1452732 RepID=A0AAX3LXI0_9BACL|nr:hypothetical protein [Paenibacillus kyungheensis]WCT54181.1 hypothetical protein PQ456_13310 [Paenibacillus kyungheensis]